MKQYFYDGLFEIEIDGDCVKINGNKEKLPNKMYFDQLCGIFVYDNFNIVPIIGDNGTVEYQVFDGKKFVANIKHLGDIEILDVFGQL